MALEYRCCDTGFFISILVASLLVVFAGLMSGLTLGLMSMSLVDLEVLAKSGTPTDRQHASKILPVVRKQHLLLCTLLICNAAAMEALPIFLDSLVTAWGAILISVTLILLFGEVSSFSGQIYSFSLNGIASLWLLVLYTDLHIQTQRFSSICRSFPKLFVLDMVWQLVQNWLHLSEFLFGSVFQLLDFLLGKGNEPLFCRAELKTLVDLHGNEAGKGGELTRDETTIITGALELSAKKARDAMTPISETFAIDINAKLDRNLRQLILEKGHSRVPVYYQRPTNIIGLVLVKNLLTIHPENEVPMKNIPIRRIPRVSEAVPLYDILNEFQKGHSHMAVVIRHQGETEQPAGEHSTVDTDVRVDIDGESHLKDKCLKTKRSLKKSSFSHDPNLHRGASKSKKWTNPEVLHITDDPLPVTTGEGEAIGIITLEDVIEELLQEEIYDETDYQAENN